MVADFIFPKPRDWATFEDVVCDVFTRKFCNYNFQRYGRSGQAQSGIDIAGPTENGLIGIQCKHHPTGNIEIAEINDEIAKAESFTPTLDEFIIATSADRDVNAHSYVLDISEVRKGEGKFPVSIKFWDDIYGWLIEYPDLLYKHFTKHFPIRELVQIELPGLDLNNRISTIWPATRGEVIKNALKTIGGIAKTDPYKVNFGITTFAEYTFQGKVDLEVNLADLFSGNGAPEESFVKANQVLRDVRALLNNPFFSNELTVFLQARLSLAMLLGWSFRKVSHYYLVIKAGEQIWSTRGLPLVPAGIYDRPSILENPTSHEIVLILNMCRDVTKSALRFVKTWGEQPQWIITTDMNGPAVTSAAHALSLSLEISHKIKVLHDTWEAEKIHLFTAMPASLAVLVSYHLNAICPIHLYLMDHTQNTYKLAGILSNDM